MEQPELTHIRTLEHMLEAKLDSVNDLVIKCQNGDIAVPNFQDVNYRDIDNLYEARPDLQITTTNSHEFLPLIRQAYVSVFNTGSMKVTSSIHHHEMEHYKRIMEIAEKKKLEPFVSYKLIFF
jgi:hypothetical protein